MCRRISYIFSSTSRHGSVGGSTCRISDTFRLPQIWRKRGNSCISLPPVCSHSLNCSSCKPWTYDLQTLAETALPFPQTNGQDQGRPLQVRIFHCSRVQRLRHFVGTSRITTCDTREVVCNKPLCLSHNSNCSTSNGSERVSHCLTSGHVEEFEGKKHTSA
jgi:hypothetical protein